MHVLHPRRRNHASSTCAREATRLVVAETQAPCCGGKRNGFLPTILSQAHSLLHRLLHVLRVLKRVPQELRPQKVHQQSQLCDGDRGATDKRPIEQACCGERNLRKDTVLRTDGKPHAARAYIASGWGSHSTMESQMCGA